MKVEFYTDTGCLRSNNEDSYYFDKKEKVFAVFDGMGGTDYGELASKLCVESLKESIGHFKTLENIAEDFCANWTQMMYQHPQYKWKGGSTAIICQFEGNNLKVCNIGDSRCTLIRNGKIVFQTEDQNHPYAPNILLNCLSLQTDTKVGDIVEIELKKNDKIVLTTDGIHDYMDTRQFDTKTVNETKEKFLESCKKMNLEIIRNHINSNGSKDNHTALLINWER